MVRFFSMVIMSAAVLSGCLSVGGKAKVSEVKEAPPKKISWIEEERKPVHTSFKFDYFANTRFGGGHLALIGAKNTVFNMTKEELDSQIKHECQALAGDLSHMYNVFNLYNKGKMSAEELNYILSQSMLESMEVMQYSSPVLYGSKTYLSLGYIAKSISFKKASDASIDINNFKDKCISEIGYVKYETFVKKNREYGTN